MAERIIRGELLEAKRLQNSKNGNPQFRLSIIEHNGPTRRMLMPKTQVDGSVGYSVGNFTHSRYKDVVLEFWLEDNRVTHITEVTS